MTERVHSDQNDLDQLDLDHLPWTCPDCGGPVSYSLTCHTWPRRRDDGTDQWMSCMPCDSAYRFSCAAWLDDEVPTDCNWSWTLGLNPHNPRSTDNDAACPRWAAEASQRFCHK